MHPRDLVDYLLDRGLIEENSTWSRPVQISTTSSRYDNFLVTAGDRQQYFIKQSSSRTTASFLAREAVAYEILWSELAGAGLQRYVPRYIRHDPDTNTLVLELVLDANDFMHHLADHRDQLDSYAAQLGTFFGMLHSDTALAEAARRRLPLPTPWVCSLPSPSLDTFATSSGATRRLVSIIQQRCELSEALEELARTWEPRSLVHFDFKWGNSLVSDPSKRGSDSIDYEGGAHHPVMKVIDWEFSGFGDPRWDVGSVFESFVSTWLRSIPMTGDRAPEHYLEAARWPFPAFESALEAFLVAYRAFVPLDDDALIQAMRFAGARLIQSAYESAQTFNKLHCSVICSMQVGENLLMRPEEGMAALLGEMV